MGGNCCHPDNDNKDITKTDGETLQLGHDVNYDRKEKEVQGGHPSESQAPSLNVIFFS